MSDELRQDATLDLDTRQLGHAPPFADWEGDHTAVVHVLWSARARGLTLADADKIATMLTRSRALKAREHFAAAAAVAERDQLRQAVEAAREVCDAIEDEQANRCVNRGPRQPCTDECQRGGRDLDRIRTALAAAVPAGEQP